jgi:hypothetical protein
MSLIRHALPGAWRLFLDNCIETLQSVLKRYSLNAR